MHQIRAPRTRSMTAPAGLALTAIAALCLAAGWPAAANAEPPHERAVVAPRVAVARPQARVEAVAPRVAPAAPRFAASIAAAPRIADRDHDFRRGFGWADRDHDHDRDFRPGWRAGAIGLAIAPAVIGYPFAGYEYAAPVASGTWYYCADPAGYYPYVTQCYSGWQAVPAG